MKAASEPAKFASSSGSGTAQAKGSRRLKVSISRAQLILCALGLLVSTSLVAFVEPLRTDPYQETGMVSWFYPAEHNAHKRLQGITCDLNAICAVSGGSVIWAVGDRGLAARSSDAGRSWNQVELPSPEPRPANQIKGARPVPTANKAARAPATAPATKFKSQVVRQPLMHGGPIDSATADESSPNDSRDFSEAESSSHGPNAGANLGYGEADQQQAPAQKEAQTNKSPNQVSPNRDPVKPENEKADQTPSKERNDQQKPSAIDNKQKGTTGGGTSVTPYKKGSVAAKRSRPAGRSTGTSPAVTRDSTTPGSTPLLPPENFVAVRFVDEKRGWILGHLGTLYSTADGGINWSQQSVSEPIKSAQLSDDGVVVTKLFDRLPDTPQSESDPTWHLAGNGILGAFVSPDKQRRWVVGPRGDLFRMSGLPDKAELDRVLPRPTEPITAGMAPKPDLWGIYFVNTQRGWATGAAGTILATTDGGETWGEQQSNTASTLKAIAFTADARLGWAAGTDGTIISTTDGGRTWVHNTQGSESKQFASEGEHRRALPRWYYAALGLAAVLLGLAALAPARAAVSEEESVADTPSSDRPLEAGDPDALDLNAIALGLSRFLRNENTMPPLTIAITGDWGTGKSSLMNLLRADLCRYKFRPVWFNAWHHQKEHNLLAALLQSLKFQAIPRWYLPRGLVFRLRLIAIRTRKHVIPVLGLVLLFSFLAGYELNHHEHGADIKSVAEFLTPTDFPTLLDNIRKLISDTTRIGLLVSILGVVGTCWRGVRAFGVKPGSLLSHFSGSVKLGELEAQTSFREKFARQFAEVTQALGVRTMPIFIDDLDRCRPEQALEVLEAVNFLASSGECFVVVAMARPQVEACVGLSFKDVAEEIGNYDGGHGPEQIRLRRRDFARQYLDKLINIEVPIPSPTEDQSQKLLTEEGRLLKEPPKDSLELLKTMLTRGRPLILTSVIVAVIAGGGYFLGKRVTFHSEPNKAAPTESTKTPGNDSLTTDQTGVPAPSRNGVTPGPTAKTPDEAVTFDKPRIIPPSTNPLHWGYWIAVLGSAALLWLWFYISLFQPDPVVRDSRTFKDALRIWHSVVYAGQSTPRAIKRFRNRVRYLAMRQRATNHGAADSSSASEPNGDSLIPESILVALASIQHFNPEWIEDDKQFKQVCEPPRPHPISSESGMDLLHKAVATHVQEFGNWSDLAERRKAYLKMCATVRVR